MDTLLILLGLGGLAVLGVGLWLRRAQARFVAGLRAEGDPLADHPGSKAFRQRFTLWLLNLVGERRPPSQAVRVLVTALMLLLVGAAAVWSLMPMVFG